MSEGSILGSKNRILLGILTDIILHHFRNTLLKKELYITKLKVKKIANKHPEIIHFITQHNFYLESGTLFYTSKRQLKKCVESIKFFNKKYEEDFLNFIES